MTLLKKPNGNSESRPAGCRDLDFGIVTVTYGIILSIIGARLGIWALFSVTD